MRLASKEWRVETSDFHKPEYAAIYKALKTSSDYHFMSIDRYVKEKDQWKHKGVKGDWVRSETVKD